MKTCINKLLKAKIAKWSLPALLIAVVAASIAWSNGDHRQYQMGGAWIGGAGDGGIWNSLQIPLDPAGRTAAVRIHTTMYGEAFAGLLTGFGADSATEAVAETRMISRDTAKFGSVFYLQQQGNPPTLRAIVVMTGTTKLTGPDNFFVDYTLNVYLPSADANKDGFPDANAVPALTIPGGHDTAKRVPIP